MKIKDSISCNEFLFILFQNFIIFIQIIKFKIQSRSMGPNMTSMLSRPNADIKHEQLQTNYGVSVTSASVQGWRQYMEDYYCMKQLDEEVILAGVFDGHGGPEVACYVSRRFYKQFQNQPFFALKNYNRALVNAFKRVDEMIRSSKGEQQLIEIQKQVNRSEIQAREKQQYVIGEQVGTTANILLLTPKKIYLANIGDSRAVLCRNGQAIALSEDHKPINPDEKARITKAGGHITHNRINGNINISRTFGDFYYKSNKNKPYNEQMVISIPDIKEMERKKGEDQYILIASDGVWQKFGNDNQALVNKFNNHLIHTQNWKEALKQFLLSLLPEALVENQTGYDNMTIVLVMLNELASKHKENPVETQNSEIKNKQG